MPELEKTLLDKLQFKDAYNPLLFRAHKSAHELLSDSGVEWHLRIGKKHDFVMAFFESNAAVEAHALKLLASAAPGARVWFCYAKKTSKLHRDLNRDQGWAIIAGSKWLPVTQVSFDEDWSAMRWKRREDIEKVTRKEEPK